MLTNLIVVITAIITGLVISLSLIYVIKFKEYVIAKKKSVGSYWTIIDIIWRIFLPILFGFITLILPVKIMYYIIGNKNVVQNLTSIYLFSFVPCFFVSIFVLVKIGKIKLDKKLH